MKNGWVLTVRVLDGASWEDIDAILTCARIAMGAEDLFSSGPVYHDGKLVGEYEARREEIELPNIPLYGDGRGVCVVEPHPPVAPARHPDASDQLRM